MSLKKPFDKEKRYLWKRYGMKRGIMVITLGQLLSSTG